MNATPLSQLSRRLAFTGNQQVCCEPFELPPPGEGEVLVRVALSLMSTGTENIVFNRLFDPGTHWDNWVKYPFYPGYCAVGRVEAVGSGVTGLKVGDRVAGRITHRSHAVAAVEHCYPIPDGVPDEQAVWFALAKIAFHAAEAAGYRLGDSVLIVGAGPIGQMSTRWARAAGAASIMVVDAMAGRLELAQKGGATAALSMPIDEAREAVLEAGHGRLPRVVVDSTGNAEVFSTALGLVEQYGTMIILGDTGRPATQHLTSDVITRGLTIRGVHDGHNTAQWNDATISQLFFKLAASGRFPLDGLNSHNPAPWECEEAYAAVNRDRASTMGVVFDWREGEGN